MVFVIIALLLVWLVIKAYKSPYVDVDDAIREMDKINKELDKLGRSIDSTNARIAKEQARQAAVLEKHEKRITDLEYKVKKIDRDIERNGELLADYYAQLDWLLLQQSGTVPSGKDFASWQSKIVTKQNQVRTIECRIEDLKDARERAAKEISA